MSPASNQILISKLTKSYSSGRRNIRVLRGIDLSVSDGEYIAITGPSGCGKSTLLNLLGGLDVPDSGTVDIFGTRLDDLTQDQLARWRGRDVGIIFQFFQLMPTLTALENVVLPMDLVGDSAGSRSRAQALLDRVGIGDLGDNLPSELSGGEQQRVAIARALANSPRLLLADEPTGNLDSATGTQIVDILEDLWRHGTTLIMVTHDPSLATRATRVIEMLDGRIDYDSLISESGSRVPTLNAHVTP